MENRIPKWLDLAEYPFAAHYLLIDGQKLHYIDEGQGPVLLFVHGTPSWSFDFRAQISALSRRFRCIAIDHIGFGLSDKPKDYDYSVQNHAKTLEKFIEQLGLKNIVLLVHDFGGPIGLNYALNFPENVQKMVILNSWLWNCENEPEFRKLKPILKSPLTRILYRYFNFSPQFLLPQSFYNPKKLTSKLRKHYTRPFAHVNERNGVWAFAQSLLNDQPWFETLWLKVERIAQKPTLFVWGMDDKFVSQKYLDRFTVPFQNKTVVKLKNCGHFPQEEQSQLVLEAIETFLIN